MAGLGALACASVPHLAFGRVRRGGPNETTMRAQSIAAQLARARHALCLDVGWSIYHPGGRRSRLLIQAARHGVLLLTFYHLLSRLPLVLRCRWLQQRVTKSLRHVWRQRPYRGLFKHSSSKEGKGEG